MAQPQANLARIVAQHAETSKLLGVDFVPRYRRGGAVAPIVTAPVAAGVPAAAAASGPAKGKAAGAAAGDSRQAAQAKLDAIRERYIADAPHQHFNTTFTNIVFGEGDPCARLMFIGEAPGEDEDLSGRPFVGRAGQLLEKMINAMGLARADVYIANVLKTRPPGNATPTPEEADLCKPYLFDQIEAIRPEAIVTLGLPATKLILATTIEDADSRTMGSMRSIWAEFKHPNATNPDGSPVTVPVMPTYHPAYVLRNYTDETRAKVWSDLKKVMDKLGLGAKATK
jgi:uracil-DNA glycosylase